MRSSWVYCPKQKRLVPKDEFYANFSIEQTPLICPDIADFVSTVDGSVIHGRASLREHNKRHGVTFAEDYRDEWKKKARERADFFAGKRPQSITRQHIAEAYEKVRGGYKPNVQKGEF